jgi:hypothetical protein
MLWGIDIYIYNQLDMNEWFCVKTCDAPSHSHCNFFQGNLRRNTAGKTLHHIEAFNGKFM